MRAFCSRVVAILAVLAGIATLEALFAGTLPVAGALVLLAACGWLAWRLFRRELRRSPKRRRPQPGPAHRQRPAAQPAPLQLAAKPPAFPGPHAA